MVHHRMILITGSTQVATMRCNRTASTLPFLLGDLQIAHT